VVAGVIAGILTYCDLDTVFDAPPSALNWRPWLRLSVWWWGFIFANAALAGILFFALKDKQPFKDWNPWIGGLLAGASYTALVRLQLTTLQVNGKNSAIGLETLYEALKGLVHRRINRVIRTWRMQESAILAQTKLTDLRDRALMMVGSDSLMTGEQRTSTKKWIQDTSCHEGTPESDRRISLALYIITEQRPS
jgi:hypothetical protein